HLRRFLIATLLHVEWVDGPYRVVNTIAYNRFHFVTRDLRRVRSVLEREDRRPPGADGDRRKGGSRLLTDVDHTRDAELVCQRAELVVPHLLLQRHRDRAAGGELLP